MLRCVSLALCLTTIVAQSLPFTSYYAPKNNKRYDAGGSGREDYRPRPSNVYGRKPLDASPVLRQEIYPDNDSYNPKQGRYPDRDYYNPQQGSYRDNDYYGQPQAQPSYPDRDYRSPKQDNGYPAKDNLRYPVKNSYPPRQSPSYPPRKDYYPDNNNDENNYPRGDYYPEKPDAYPKKGSYPDSSYNDKYNNDNVPPKDGYYPVQRNDYPDKDYNNYPSANPRYPTGNAPSRRPVPKPAAAPLNGDVFSNFPGFGDFDKFLKYPDFPALKKN